MSNVPKVANFITHSFPVTSSRQTQFFSVLQHGHFTVRQWWLGTVLTILKLGGGYWGPRWQSKISTLVQVQVLVAALEVQGQHCWSRGATHTPSIAFRHLPQRKDVVNQCLEFGGCIVSQGSAALCGFRSLYWQSRVAALTVSSRASIPIIMGLEGCNDSQGSAPLQSKVSTPIWVQRTALTVMGQHQRAALTVTISTRGLH